jgi:hypothetical protein
MYLRSIELSGLRSIDELRWSLEAGRDAAGWHVIIGDNGAGKSTILRSVALALVGDGEAAALRQNWDEWLRRGAQRGHITLSLERDAEFDAFSKAGRAPKSKALRLGLSLERSEMGVTLGRPKVSPDPTRHVWGPGAGWFSASYGPFRRFSGGDKDQEKLFFSNPRLARHLSVFGESIALSEAVEWLKTLRFRALEKNVEAARFLESLRVFVNQPDFLPHGATLESVSSEGVHFKDGNGYTLPVNALSDGYRSVLSMTFELVRQLAATFGIDRVFSADRTRVVPSGLVLIDEVDAHLHPTWQRRIGPWFRRHFPRLQFIVTTHSPFVCQSAEAGTVFRLPQPGSEDRGRMITGVELDRLLYGNILDAYGTGLFGDGATRSEAAQAKLQRLAELNLKSLRAQLAKTEAIEHDQLRAVMSTVRLGEPTA